MPRAAKACGKCGTPSPTSTCRACQPPKPSGRHSKSSTERGYDSRWQKLRAHAVRRQPWCAWPGGCSYEINRSNPLTGDHWVPLSEAPERRLDPKNVVVLCARHNSKKSNRRLD